MFSGHICDVPGIMVGNASDLDALTGVTAIYCPDGAVPGVCVRGGAPGTRETDLMKPGELVECVNAILLTGGSAYGLDASTGAMDLLRRRGEGLDVGVSRVPIVGGAVLFDLGVGSAEYVVKTKIRMTVTTAKNAQAKKIHCSAFSLI